MSSESFKAKYGRNKKTRTRFNAAIRAECAGGGELLELLELVSSMYGRAETQEEGSKLKAIEDRLQSVRAAMAAAVRQTWEIQEIKG